MEWSFGLHAIVGWAATTLWVNPVDVLLHVFDITGLAVNAILSVYLQLPRSIGVNVFVDTGGTESLLWSVVDWEVYFLRN